MAIETNGIPLSATEAAAASALPILEIGRGFMMDPATWARAEELGVAASGMFGFWVNGRAGVLGDVDSGIAAAAIGFMAPAVVEAHWSARPAELSAWEAAIAWFDCAASWGRATFAEMAEADLRRLADLARTVIDGADRSLGALFAGSALVPLPGDAAGDAAINLNVLREMRGGAHLSACHAAGLGPHATIMSTDNPVRGGVSWSETLGWAAPHPEPRPDARVQVEELTTNAVAPAFETLTGPERADFVALVTEARNCLPD